MPSAAPAEMPATVPGGEATNSADAPPTPTADVTAPESYSLATPYPYGFRGYP